MFEAKEAESVTEASQEDSKLKNISFILYRPDIDGLRAIAVLVTVGFHAFPSVIKGGFIGVDIFFVISGFLISSIIFAGLKAETFSFIDFYGRRIRRIFPALTIVMAGSIVFGWFALLPDEFAQLGRHVAGGAGYVSNFILHSESGYFDTIAETKPLLHLWSLAIEEQFYIVWPLLLWMTWKKRFNILTIAIVAFAISFAINISKIRGDAVGTFYFPHSRFWELLAGAILAYVMLYRQGKIAAFAGSLIYDKSANKVGANNYLSAIGFCLLGIGLLVITKEKAFPGWWAALPVAGTALILSAGQDAWLNRRILSNRVLVWFGLISYPLYLWHWPILSFAHIVKGGAPSRDTRILAVIASIVLAWLTYKLVEKPLRYGGKIVLKTVVLLVAMVSIGCVGYILHLNDGAPSRSAVQQFKQVNSEFTGAIWKFANNDLCKTRYPMPNSSEYGWWFCSANKDENPTFILLGNSFANQHYPGFSQHASFQHHSVLSIGTCEPSWVEESLYFQTGNGQDSNPCVGNRQAQQQRFIDNIIKTSGSVKYAIIDGMSLPLTAEYIERLKKRIDFLESNNVRVIVFTPHVKLGYDIKHCFSRPLATPLKNCEIEIGERAKADSEMQALQSILSKTNPNVLFFDQNDLFCNDGKCSGIREGMPLFRDHYDHISEHGSMLLTGMFAEWAKTNLPDILDAEKR